MPGSTRSPSTTSSNPTIATFHCSPSSRSARTAPIVIRFWPVKSAVGGSSRARISNVARRAAALSTSSVHSSSGACAMRAASSAWW